MRTRSSQNPIAAALVGTLALSTPALAVEPVIGAVLGTSVEEISAALAEDGYRISEYEHEHGKIEVETVKDGRRRELKIDPSTGAIVSLENDD